MSNKLLRAEIQKITESSQIASLTKLKQLVWPNEPVSDISPLLGMPTHALFVAFVGNVMSGFVSCFETAGSNQQRRWEIDLLAVHPDFRGEGIAKSLIAAATQEGARRGIPIARALIATSNVASQCAFAATGYCSNGMEHYLYIKRNNVYQAALRVDNSLICNLIRITSMSYDGLWIEPPWQKEDFAHAQQLLTTESLQLAGAVIPKEDDSVHHHAERLEYFCIGNYEWWEKKLADRSHIHHV